MRRDKVSRYSLSTLAAEVGEGEFTSSVRSRGEDEVINALQLETASGPHYGTSRQLAEQFIKKVALKLGLLAPADVLTGRQVTRFRRAAVAALAVSAVFWIAFFPFFQESAKHWIHPRTNFPVSHPFELVSLTGDLSLMGGDSTTIEFDVKGDSPGTISLEILEGDKSSLVQLDPGADGRFVHELPHVFQNLHYRAFVRSRHFWEPWGKISSPTYTISVIDRPAIREFVITITPPGYTGMSPMSQKENVAEIRALKGSSIGVHLTSDKILSRAYLRYVTAESPDRPSRIAMNVSQKGATGEILLTDDSAFETHIFDERDVGNLDPIQYRILMVEDVLPELQVLEPESPTELGSDFAIPVRLHIEDDFGFSNVQIVYETRHPAYLSGGVSSPPATTSESFGESHETVNVRGINTFSPEETSQDVFYIWDVGKLGLMPEDEIRFHFEVYDNDVVSGPKKSISPTLVARFPSLADLYARTEKEEQAVQDVAGEIVDDLQELDKALQSVELEVLKTEELSWEHEQTLKQSSADLQKKLEEIEGVRRKLQNIVEQSERHRLFSPDLLQKFKNLQDLLQDIITPELMESLDKLTESLGEVPAEDLLRALQNFRSNTAEIEHQLDRFIDIFQRIRAERRMDELVTRTEQLVSQQESLVTKLRVNSTETSGPRLTEEQQRNAQEFENIHDLMEDASKDMKSFA
ncbi:MAG: hypothetical protein ACE5GH_06840, partial [Fidelibacterota bacterium]